MPTVTNGRVIFAKHATGLIEPGITTQYVEEQLDLDAVPLNGGVLLKTYALSSDPYIRDRLRAPNALGFTEIAPIGQPIDNFGVAVVVRSEDPHFEPGDYVSGFLNFENYSVWPSPPKQQNFFKQVTPLRKITASPKIPLTAHIGILGLTGGTAWTGWKMLAEEKAKRSNVLYVSTAAGAVGSVVVQLAKLTCPNLKIIGSAGSPEKVKYMKDIGVDVPFNYKERDLRDVLKEHGPVDIYWDHIAGETLDKVLEFMAPFGLIVSCGRISTLNGKSEGVERFELIVARCLTIRGHLFGMGEEQGRLLSTSFGPEMCKLLEEGKIKVKEHRYHGLKNAGEALRDVHTGGNTGKPVIMVDKD